MGMARLSVDELRERLTDRDLAILDDLDAYRLLGTRHIQRLHFTDGHQSAGAAMRACTRVLARLRDVGAVAFLPQRRVGGISKGSSGLVWFLGPAGERLQRDRRGRTARRRYGEPSRHFVNHTLAVADLAVRLVELERSHEAFEIVSLRAEPDSWQTYLSGHGVRQWLKPDLALIAVNGEFEDHWFIEVDLDTEHVPVLLRQCAAYHSYRASGQHQAAHDLFPAVLWVTPTSARAESIRRAIHNTPTFAADAYRVCIVSDFIATVLGTEELGSGIGA
jgi:hypothetical protein